MDSKPGTNFLKLFSGKIYLLFSIIIWIACNAREKSSSLENSVSDINWDSVKVQELPYHLALDREVLDHIESIDELYGYLGEKQLHQELNALFNDSTVINTVKRPFEANVYPNVNEGYFYKRFPDISDYKVLLFCSLGEPGEMVPYPTFEIQIFDTANICIDKMIVADGLNGEDCEWKRSFTYDKNNIISITDEVICIDPEDQNNNDKKETSFAYKIKSNGKIVEYFEKEYVDINRPSGITFPIFKDTLDEDGLEFNKVIGEKEFFTKGIVKNHFKEGVWEEYNVYEKQLEDYEGGLFPYATGSYKEGEKVGEWIYFTQDLRHPEDFIEYERIVYAKQ